MGFRRPHRIVGSMMQYIENYEEREIDELIILDVEATREGREPLYEDIKEYTAKLFCPLTVGGGIQQLEHIENLLNAGADKIAVNTSLYRRPDFIYQAARKYGSQCIVVSINNTLVDGRNRYTDSGGIFVNQATTKEMCKYAQELGAGEILLTDTIANGRMQGYNNDCIFECSYDLTIPIVCYGGCGEPRHMVDALVAGGAAVAASSMFMFKDTTPKECSRYINKLGFAARV